MTFKKDDYVLCLKNCPVPFIKTSFTAGHVYKVREDYDGGEFLRVYIDDSGIENG